MITDPVRSSISNRPEDIPQDVWDATTETFDQMLCCSGYEGSRDDSIEVIARAIMAATRAEREACATVAEGCRIEPEVDHVGLVDGANRACVKVARAIRKRGEG